MKDLFHHTVPDVERNALLKSDAYRFALHVTANVPNLTVINIAVVEAQPSKPTVLFSTREGAPVMKLIWNFEDDEWDVFLNSSSTRLSWEHWVSSDRLPYLSKAVTKINPQTKVSRALAGMTEVWVNSRDERNMVLTCVRNAHHKISSSLNTKIDYNSMLTSSQIGTLLKVFSGEETALNVPIDHRQAFETVLIERNKRRDNAKTIKAKMEEMFARPKWLISYLPSHGYNVTGVDVSCTWQNILDSGQATRDAAKHYAVTHPQQFCRTLDDLLWTQSEQEKSTQSALMGSLTLNKMHINGRYSHLQYGAEPHDMLPTRLGTSEVIVCEELNSVMLTMGDSTVLMVNQ